MHSFFHREHEDPNAEDVAVCQTTPVFGKGVACDVPNPVFLEQKKMLKIAYLLEEEGKMVPISLQILQEQR